MDNKDYESSEFYSYKFKNFSTIIIVPMAILVLLLFVGSFFAVRQNTVSSVGIVEPKNVLTAPIASHHEGQIIKKNTRIELINQRKFKLKKDYIVHLNESKKLAQLMPRINNKSPLQITVYLPSSKIAAIKKGQIVHFQIANNQGNTLRLNGKVKQVGVYPMTVQKQNVYQVLCSLRLKEAFNIRYGMQGDATLVTGKTTYFEYFKDKILNQK